MSQPTDKSSFDQQPLVFTCSYCKSDKHVRKLRASVMVPGEHSARGAMTAFVCKHCLESVAEMFRTRIEWFDEKLQADTKLRIDPEDEASGGPG